MKRFEIVYTNNEQLWSLERIAASHGFKKTEECYWVQIFTDSAGNNIITTREEGELFTDPIERLNAMLAPEMVSVSDLTDDLNTGEHGDALTDYRDSSTYICDAIAEAADQRVSIYYSDILDFIRENPEALEDVVSQGLYDLTPKSYNLYSHAQAAEYMTIERDIYDHLADSLMMAALNFILYDLKRETIPGELADQLRDWCDDADTDDRMSEISDRIREYFGEED